jgi:two-component system cell cycle sensor histidine kinase/response regulator CckA
MTKPSARWLAGCLLLTALYVLAGRVGLALALVNPSATAVWPPSGIALAAVLMFGQRIWPAIFLGAFLTNAMTAGNAATSLLIATGNTLEAMAGAYLVHRFAGGRSPFETVGTILRYVLLGGFISTAISATVGVTTLSLFGFSPWTMYGSTWLTWWLGNVAGAIVVAPALILWREHPQVRWAAGKWLELLSLVLVLTAVAWIVFVISGYPLGYLCIPIVVWAAWRFGQREAAAATCMLSVLAIWGSLDGRGTFGGHTPNDTLLLLQSFMAIISIVGLTLGASVSGRDRAEARLRRANDELEARVRARAQELQSAHDRLANSESRLKEAQELAHVGSWEWVVADDGEWWSEELYRICGVDPASFGPTYQAFMAMLPADERAAVNAVVQKALVDHRPFQFDHHIVRPDGTVRLLTSQGRVVVDAGRVVRMSGASQDITERKAAEEVVRRSERRLQTIIDAEPACVKLVSPDGVLLEMNPAGLAMLGAADIAQVRGHQVSDLVHPDDRDRFLEAHRAASTGLAGRCTFRICGLDGGERWVDSHLVPFDIAREADVERAVLSVTTDITERKRLEDQLRQSQKLEAIGLLAGGIAHDFNNLLTAIGGYTDMVLETLGSDDGRRDELQEVAKAAQRGSALTRQLLAVSRRQVLQPTVLDVNAMVASVQKLLHRTIQEDIEVQLELSSALEPVRADRGQLEQVLLNLAINAGDAMPQGGRLRLATETVDLDEPAARRRPPMPPGRYVRLTVSDTGIGMTPEIQTHIFEPFFTTKAQGRGTGLGLATVYGIVKQSGGFIWVQSAVGQGTTFEIYLPVVQEAIEWAVDIPLTVEYGGGSQTILLAEDDGAVRRFARDVLSKHGYVVLDARDGEEALALARRRRGVIHLLITDVVMPGLSGRDLAARVTAERPDLRVLYTSGYTGNVMMRAGSDTDLRLLPKPFLPADLLRRVGETLRAADPQ